jgi:hypothetical protein
MNRFFAVLLFTICSALPGFSQDILSIEQILDRMSSRSDWQNRKLSEVQVDRKFYAANARFKTDSTMVVHTIYRPPDETQSTIVSQQGSNLIRTRVFDKILEAETETSSKKAKQQVDIIPANYRFSLVVPEMEECDGRSCFHLKISPKRRDKYSLDGDIWVDAADYSIVRIHGTPAKRPSLWTLHTEIDRRYKKIGDLWLPDRLESSSNVMIAGHSVLSIEYSYQSVQTVAAGVP